MSSNNHPLPNQQNAIASQASGQMVAAPAMLTYPGNSNQVNSGVRNSSDLQNTSSQGSTQKRPPRNLQFLLWCFQGLLKFAMEATQAEDAPGNKDLTPMDEESLTVNIAEVLDNAIKVLTNSEKINSINEDEPLPDEVKNSFTVLLDHVDDLDVANVISSQLQAGRNESSEHLLSILQVLVSSKDPTTLRLFRDQSYNLKKVLEDYLNLPELKDDRFFEEKQFCSEILSTVFANQSSVEEPAR
ncbi:hypothetical protein HF086_007017 [Spodoptera exigua]|uniref:Uncharacterized protein n=1 Tax=Spodoptera exigua TaxID=7107 RepID=A0A922MZE8_SPOEX|nr:hypothetical protein HF086_007017 [Spodoptera exigua]